MKKLSPPIAEKRPETSKWHGLDKTDYYAWLRDENWQNVMRNPKLLDLGVRNYLEAENDYTDGILAPLANEIESLYAEMKSRTKEEDATVPMPDGTWLYYGRFRAGGQHRIHCRSSRDGGAEQILFDGDQAAEGSDYFQLKAFKHSPNHSLAAYAADFNGSEICSIRFRDLSKGRDLPEIIENTNGNFAWFADSAGMLYTVLVKILRVIAGYIRNRIRVSSLEFRRLKPGS